MDNGSSYSCLDRWHKVVFQRNAQELQAMLAEDVVFHSPYLPEPYAGREATALILTTVSEVLQDFTYHREIIEGTSWALEFSARVGDQWLKGIDLIRLDDDGLIVEFEAFVRPYNGLRALGVAMARRLNRAS
jgi:hypothetical protein